MADFDPSPPRGAWRKSTFSEPEECVEVAFTDNAVLVRNSRDRSGPVLAFTVAEWAAFVGGVRSGEFDLG